MVSDEWEARCLICPTNVSKSGDPMARFRHKIDTLSFRYGLRHLPVLSAERQFAETPDGLADVAENGMGRSAREKSVCELGTI